VIRIPFTTQGIGFEPFPKFSFSFTNEMDENKLPLGIFRNLVAQEQFFRRKPCSQTMA
jgi:hypothetical protein